MSGVLTAQLSVFWLNCQMDVLDVVPPDRGDLFEELMHIRRLGIAALGRRSYPALERAVIAAGRIDPGESVGAYAVEQIIRDAAVQIGGDLGDAALLIFGLEEGARSDSPTELRKMGAEACGVSVSQFRHRHEHIIRDQIAHLIETEIHQHRLHVSALRRDVRSPVASRLAIEWLDRFEAMYSMWNSLTGVGNDLSAYRSTMLEEDRPWDGAGGDEEYTQEIQAAGYVTAALFHHTTFLCRLRDFQKRYGGLWLLPEASVESALADAAHRAVLTSPNNERDDSYLRSLLDGVPEQEFDGFLRAIKDDEIAMSIHDEWQDWVATCGCSWDLGSRQGREIFPTAINNTLISDQCDMHMLISACNDYCLLLDDSWDQIADWYRDAPKPYRKGTTAEEVYSLRDNPLPEHIK